MGFKKEVKAELKRLKSRLEDLEKKKEIEPLDSIGSFYDNKLIELSQAEDEWVINFVRLVLEKTGCFDIEIIMLQHPIYAKEMVVTYAVKIRGVTYNAIVSFKGDRTIRSILNNIQ